MRTLHKSTCFIFCVFITSCTHHVPSQYDGAQVKYANGVTTKAAVIAEWGIPNASISLNSASTAYQWNSDNGSTATGAFDSDTVGSGIATSATDCLNCGVDTFGIGSSHSTGTSAQNIETHSCALSIIVENKTDTVQSASLVGTVDEKCYSHFSKALTLSKRAVDVHEAEISHNKKVSVTKSIVGILALIGGGAAVYNANH